LSQKGFQEATKDPLIAFLVAFGILSVLLLIPDLWAVTWAVIMSFLLFEAMMSTLVRGGSGIFQFSPLGTHAKHKGHAFLIFFALILFVTVLTAAFSELIAKQVVSAWPAVLAANLIACIGLFIYMDMAYFRR